MTSKSELLISPHSFHLQLLKSQPGHFWGSKQGTFRGLISGYTFTDSDFLKSYPKGHLTIWKWVTPPYNESVIWMLFEIQHTCIILLLLYKYVCKLNQFLSSKLHQNSLNLTFHIKKCWNMPSATCWNFRVKSNKCHTHVICENLYLINRKSSHVYKKMVLIFET